MTSIAQIRFDYKRSPSERPDEYALRLVNRCVELERQCKEAEASASSETGERHRVHDEAWYKAPPKLNLSMSCGNCGWCESRLKCPNCGAKK